MAVITDDTARPVRVFSLSYRFRAVFLWHVYHDQLIVIHAGGDEPRR